MRPGSAGLLLPPRHTSRSPLVLAALRGRTPPSQPSQAPAGESQAVLLGAIKLLLGCVETRLQAPGARAAGASPDAAPVHDTVFEAALALYRHGAGEGAAPTACIQPTSALLAAVRAPRAPVPLGAAPGEGPGTATSRTGQPPLKEEPGEQTPPPPPRVRIQRRAAAAAEASIRASKRALEGSAEPDSPPPSRARYPGRRHSHAHASSGGSDGNRAVRPRMASGAGTASSPFRGVSRHRCALNRL